MPRSREIEAPNQPVLISALSFGGNLGRQRGGREQLDVLFDIVMPVRSDRTSRRLEPGETEVEGGMRVTGGVAGDDIDEGAEDRIWERSGGGISSSRCSSQASC